jgi:hypothetical protein
VTGFPEFPNSFPYKLGQLSSSNKNLGKHKLSPFVKKKKTKERYTSFSKRIIHAYILIIAVPKITLVVSSSIHSLVARSCASCIGRARKTK